MKPNVNLIKCSIS